MVKDIKKVYIIIINFNGWEDTIECLESILKSDYSNYHIIVVDNDSTDDSMDHLLSWSNGELRSFSPKNSLLSSLSNPPFKKTVYYNVYDEHGNLDAKRRENVENAIVSYIKSSSNNGFAAGNNIGMRFAESQGDWDYVWILNNDTIVQKDTLTSLVESTNHEDKKVGIIGSLIKDYYEPDKIQSVGCKFYLPVGHIKTIKDPELFDQCDYISGASMFVSKDFIEKTGFMSEDYFLYFEEIDWIKRGSEMGYKFGLCENAIVYHKEGKSIGSSSESSKRSLLSYYYGMRGRLIYIKKYYPWFLPLTVLFLLMIILKRTMIDLKFPFYLVKLHIKQKNK